MVTWPSYTDYGYALKVVLRNLLQARYSVQKTLTSRLWVVLYVGIHKNKISGLHLLTTLLKTYFDGFGNLANTKSLVSLAKLNARITCE